MPWSCNPLMNLGSYWLQYHVEKWESTHGFYKTKTKKLCMDSLFNQCNIIHINKSIFALKYTHYLSTLMTYWENISTTHKNRIHLVRENISYPTISNNLLNLEANFSHIDKLYLIMTNNNNNHNLPIWSNITY
jgi:hypothetical protein